jgi:hypothetical protein
MILNLNNRFSIFLIVLFGTNSFFSQKVISNELNIEDVIVKFETTDSRLEGDFKVFKIIEGKEKLIVQGTMENNYRSGNWKIFDTIDSNKVLIERLYQSPFRFKQITPKIDENPFTKFIHDNFLDEQVRDSSSCLTYEYINKEDLVFSQRLFRKILLEGNSQLKHEKVYQSLLENSSTGKIHLYGDNRFSTLLDSFPDLSKEDSFIGFKIKEDFIFDKKRMVSESRILGISPIIVSKLTNQEKETPWFYFPEIRPLLAEIKIESDLGTHLDDLFVKRHFYGKIYEITDLYQRETESVSSEIYHDDIVSLLAEHDLWLIFAGLESIKE